MKNGKAFWRQPWKTRLDAMRAVIFGCESEGDFNETTGSDVALVQKYLAITKEDTVLDVGCGMGRLMKPLSQSAGNILGIDVNDSMLTFGKEYLTSANCEFKHFNGQLIPCPDEAFDKAFSFITIMHLDKHEAFFLLTEIYRVLKIGGKFMWNVPNLLKQKHHYVNYYLPRYLNAGLIVVNMFTYTPDEAKALMEIVGFEDVVVDEVAIDLFVCGTKTQRQLFPNLKLELDWERIRAMRRRG